MGQCRRWWWQFGSSRSAQGCGADSSNRWGLCCDSGRWIRCCLGSCRLWWWQFRSSRWAQGCAADSGHTVLCICCHSCRWIRRYMGSSRPVAVTLRQFEISSGVCSRFSRRGFLASTVWIESVWILMLALHSANITFLDFFISSTKWARF